MFKVNLSGRDKISPSYAFQNISCLRLIANFSGAFKSLSEFQNISCLRLILLATALIEC